MSLDVGTLRGYLELDSSNFESGLTDASGQLDEFGSSGAAKAAVIGAGIAAALGAAMALAINAEAANSKLQAQLGLNEAESARLGKTAGELYSNNYGDGLEDVNEALRFVVQNVDGMGTASEAALQGVAAKVLDLSAAFGVDLAASTRTVGVLMKTGMAKDATEALDIITKGLQSPVNAADDLLDTFDEYSTVFRTLGLDGADALGALQQGLQGGARDADQIADSLKEFQIRIQAGDAAKGLAAIGLNAEEMAAAITQGGETARTAADIIIDKFTAIQDPTVKAKVAVELFGTKAEDAQMALNGLDLSTAAADFEALNGPIAGAADAMDAALGDNRAAGIEVFKRSIETAGTSIGTALLPVVDTLLTVLGGLGEVVGDVVGWFDDLPLPMKLVGLAAIAVGVAFTAVGTAIKTAFLSNPIGIAIIGITTALGWLVGSNDSAAEAAAAHAARVTELTATLDENTGAVTANTRANVTGAIPPEKIEAYRALGINIATYTEAALGGAGATERLQRTIVGGIGAAVQLGEGYGTLSGQLAAAGVTVEDVSKAFANNDYAAVNEKLRAVGLTAYDTGDGLVTVTNAADGTTTVLADLSGKATDLRGVYNDVNVATGEVAQAQTEFATNTKEAADEALNAAANNLLLTGEARNLTEAYKILADASLGTAAAQLVLDGTARNTADAARLLGEGAGGTAVDLEALAGGADTAGPPLSVMAQLFADVDQTASDADTSIKFFNLTVNEMLGINTSAEDAAQLLNDAVRSTADVMKAATEATDGNIESLITATGAIDTTTAAGSDLRSGLGEMADAYDVTTTSAYDTAIAQGDVKGALGAAQAAADSARGKFLDTAASLGISDEKARLLADGLGIVEGTKLTDKNFAVNAQGIDAAAGGVAGIQSLVIAGKTFDVSADTTPARVALALLAAEVINTSLRLSIGAIGGGARGGQVGALQGLTGYAGGGQIPGQRPTDPRFDNMLAMGPGGLLRVQSDEWVMPTDAVDDYGPAAMSAIQNRRVPREVLQGYAMGGQVSSGGTAGGGVNIGDTIIYATFDGQPIEGRITRIVHGVNSASNRAELAGRR